MKIITPQPGPRRGFTLVELLIVVGIVAILSAIAVPNMLEAQTRAKISRTKSDLNASRTALEIYRVDAGAYPYVGNPAFPSHFDLLIPYDRRIRPLTTPIAYIENLATDPFAITPDPSRMGTTYCYSPGNLYHGAAAIYSGRNFRNTIYSIAGRGPDREITFGGYCMAHPVAYQTKANIRGLYDPTNGTVSRGDVFKLGTGTLGH